MFGRNLKQLIRLTASIYQYKVDSIILLNSTQFYSIYMLPKNKMVMSNFPNLTLK